MVRRIRLNSGSELKHMLADLYHKTVCAVGMENPAKRNFLPAVVSNQAVLGVQTISSIELINASSVLLSRLGQALW